MSAKNVVSGRTDIGPLWLNVVDVLKGKTLIDPSTYERLSYRLNGGASDNWDEVAVALDLLNRRLGHTALFGMSELMAFLRNKLADRRFMQKEFGARVYVELHYEPTVLQYAEMRRLGQTDIAEGLRGWLRALGGYLTWTGCWGVGKVPSHSVAANGPGARLVIGADHTSQRTGAAMHSVFTGKRSWHFEGEWNENIFAPVIFTDMCLGVKLRQGDIWKSHNKFIEAVEAEYGALNIFTPEEQAKLKLASQNDIEALEWVRVHVIGDWLPLEKNTFIRTTKGVGQVLHTAIKSATAPAYYGGWASDGTTYAAGADNGGRGGHGEQIENGRAEIDLASRTGWCQRTGGPDRVKVDFPLPAGDLVAVWEAQHGGLSSASYYRGGQRVAVGHSVPIPPPVGSQSASNQTKPQRRRWWEFWK